MAEQSNKHFIVFSGDRKSLIVKLGRKLKQWFSFVKVSLWDGYPSKIYTEGFNTYVMGRHMQHNKVWYKYWYPKLLNPKFIHTDEPNWKPVYKWFFWFITIK